MIILSAKQVRELLSMRQCIELVEQAMTETSAGNAVLPLRWGMPLPVGGLMGMMPGYSATPNCFGIKVVNIMPQNQGTSLSSHVGTMMLFDSGNGTPLALINAAEITAFRTAAASALATRVLARQDATVLTLIGTGQQAVSHLNAMCLVREFNEIRVCSRSMERAREFATLHCVEGVLVKAFCDVQESIDGADVICTKTNASKPFLQGDMLRSGVHVNLVGASIAEKQEADAGPCCSLVSQ